MRALEDRFWEKVDKSGECWIWTSARNSDGYGVFQRGGTTTLNAHRVAYEIAVGPIPLGLQLDHLCRVRACVNPAHLEPVTGRENTRRSCAPSGLNARKSRCPVGHDYDEVNAVGGRMCRRCRQAANVRAYEKKKARTNGALA